jgi:nicotinamide mononucleotide (NMN) deamidase PncC
VLFEVLGAVSTCTGGLVTYTKETKTELLGVSPELLRQRGAVCADVAIAMAGSALRRSPANIALAITGVAGRKPDDDHNPVGFVCIAAPVKVVLRGTPSGPTADLPSGLRALRSPSQTSMLRRGVTIDYVMLSGVPLSI